MIQMTEAKFKSYNSENISEIVGLAHPYLNHRKELYERYTRKKKEYEFMGNGSKNIIVAFEYYIVNMVQGYLGGKAPMYTVSKPSDYALKKKDKKLIEKAVEKVREALALNPKKYNEKIKTEYVKNFTEAIEYIRRYNDDAATYVEIIHDYLITAAAYLYVYENKDNEIVYARFDSRQTAAVYDYSLPQNLIGIVRVFSEKNADGKDVEAVELIDNERRRCFIDKQLDEEHIEELHWNNDVPCVAFENPDGIAVFEPSLGVVSAYETNLSNIKNMTKYNDEAKLILSGYQYESPRFIYAEDEDGNEERILNPERVSEEETVLQAKSMCVDKDGDISWLIKNVNYEGIISTLTLYHELTTMLTGVPNMTDKAFANADNASALGYKLYALDQYCATFDRIAHKGLLRLWELISSRLNLSGEKFDFRDVVITLQRNVPTDKDKSLNRAISAYSSGLVSQETALNESQIEVNARDEIERQKAEENEDYSAMKKRNDSFDNSEDDSGEVDDDEGTAESS